MIAEKKNNNLPKVAIVTNIPTPYRNPVYAEIAKKLGDDFLVIFCAHKESNRNWQIENDGFRHVLLKEKIFIRNKIYIHNNPDVWASLNKFKPDVIITTGYNPTHLYAFAWALMHGKIHTPMTDGTYESELRLTKLHRWIRKIVFKYSKAFIGTGTGSLKLYDSYGIPESHVFQSHLCADNDNFKSPDIFSRPYDLMFCGRFSSEKNPKFAIDVAVTTTKKLGRKVAMLLVGSGPLLEETKKYASQFSQFVQVHFVGFIQPSDLPSQYSQAKIFLFPSMWEPWGVVVNEACAAGQAIITSPCVGVAGDLVIDQLNGRILPLDSKLWAENVVNLLSNIDLLNQFSKQSLNQVQKFTYKNAANGIVSAVEFALATSTQNFASEPSAINTNDKKTVVIIQRRLCDYRVPLFNQLKTVLAADNIELLLLYGDGTPQEQTKGDGADIDWGEKLCTRYLFDNLICWQPFYAQVKGADLVIVTQENKLVCNLWPLFGSRSYKLAFWGHGKNLQGLPTLWGKLKECIKFLTTNRADWWFVYTGLSSQLVQKLGFPQSKITNLENSIDTTNLKNLCAQVTSDNIMEIRLKHNLGDGPIALFIGSLYQEKRLDFLLNACQQIVEKIPNFKLVVIGDGPQRAVIEKALSQFTWLRYVGRQTESNKAQYLKTANLLLNPGLIGLGILDAFAAGITIVTTDCALHSPEIDYLQNGKNGFITVNTIEDYVKTVVHILTDPAVAKNLQHSCISSANHYTIENMAQNFRAGILKALG